MSSHEEEGHAHAGSGHEPRDRVHCSAQLNGMSTPSNNSSLESLTLAVHPVSNSLPDNLQVYHLNSTAVQPEMASYSQVLCAPRQPLSQKELHSDPLLNERSWLHRAENELVQLHTKKVSLCPSTSPYPSLHFILGLIYNCFSSMFYLFFLLFVEAAPRDRVRERVRDGEEEVCFFDSG